MPYKSLNSSIMRLIKPAASVGTQTNGPTVVRPAGQPVRWSDIAANRKSTHPATAPIKRILDTVELAENVLCYVGPRDLLRIQSTCKSIDALMRTSPTLKKILWQETDDIDEIRWVLLPAPEGSRRRQICGGARAQALIAQGHDGEHTPPHGMPVYAINPFVLIPHKSSPDRLKAPLEQVQWRFDEHLSIGFYDPGRNATTRSGFKKYEQLSELAKSASIRNMQLSRPPVKKVVVKIEGRCDYMAHEDRRGLPKWYWGTRYSWEVENENGVTVGDVIEKAMPWTRGRDDSFARVHFPGGLVITEEELQAVEELG
ncbi:hypothetical protein HII31_12510 [Pseudocercospora fuligena]|uniref:F-box domain-containing protein n=1 Tax=Pseudocercospora fuligena TaxID=685502 RepID=A0A8H6R7Y3_9PEZI|nr:hypothetical protein HII31_12510 [Pseudocercospora fuligena]